MFAIHLAHAALRDRSRRGTLGFTSARDLDRGSLQLLGGDRACRSIATRNLSHASRLIEGASEGDLLAVFCDDHAERGRIFVVVGVTNAVFAKRRTPAREEPSAHRGAFDTSDVTRLLASRHDERSRGVCRRSRTAADPVRLVARRRGPVEAVHGRRHVGVQRCGRCVLGLDVPCARHSTDGRGRSLRSFMSEPTFARSIERRSFRRPVIALAPAGSRASRRVAQYERRTRSVAECGRDRGIRSVCARLERAHRAACDECTRSSSKLTTESWQA